MTRKTLIAVVAAFFVLSAVPVNGAIVTVTPSVATVAVGDMLTVDVIISDLGNFGGLSLSGFDLSLNFAVGVLSFVSVDFDPGQFLGNPSFFEAFINPFAMGPNNFAEVSALPGAALDALQPDSFILFTITFQAIDVGISPLDLFTNSLAPLADTGFPPGTLDFNPVDSSVTVMAATAAPEPGALILLGTGLLGVFWMGRRLRLIR